MDTANKFKRKRILGFVFCVCLMLIGFCVTSFAAEPEQDSDGYYQIYTVDDLYWFHDKLSAGTSVNAKLMNDITVNPGSFDENGNYTSLSGESVRDWGTSYSFASTFDGNGYTIYGLYSNREDAGFVYKNKGTIKNLTIANSYFGGSGYVGAIAAKNQNGTISNCSVVNSVVKGESSSSVHVGGLVGNMQNGLLEKCANINTTVIVNSSSDTSASIYIGGIAGEVVRACTNGNDSPNYTNTIRSCFNTGTVRVSATSFNTTYIGGIIGYLSITHDYFWDGSNITDTIENCYNFGSISSPDAGTGEIKTGGIFGSIVYTYVNSGVAFSTYTRIANCYYLDSSETDSYDGTTFKSASAFNSGEVAWLLNSGVSDDTSVFRQTLSGDTIDTFPKFTGDIVCKASNFGATKYHKPCETHTYENGFCTLCDDCQEPTLNGGCYEISNAGQLYWFAYKCNNSGTTAVNGRLTDDITVNPGTFYENGSYTPVGNETLRSWTIITSYYGTFDGGNHAIKGLYINESLDDSKSYILRIKTASVSMPTAL